MSATILGGCGDLTVPSGIALASLEATRVLSDVLRVIAEHGNTEVGDYECHAERYPEYVSASITVTFSVWVPA